MGGPNLTHPARLDSLTPRFMDYSTCWKAQDLATCGREEFAADVLVGLGPSVKSGRGERVPPPLRNGRPKFVSQEISLYPLSRGTVSCHCTVCSVRLGRQSIGHTSISHKTHCRCHSVTIDSNRQILIERCSSEWDYRLKNQLLPIFVIQKWSRACKACLRPM